MNIKFLEYENYIGSTLKQKEYTKYIHKYSRNINFMAFLHDNLYALLFNLKQPFLFFICSTLADMIFLLGGVFKALFQVNLVKGLIEIVLFIVLTVMILVYKPVYIYKRYKNGNSI